MKQFLPEWLSVLITTLVKTGLLGRKEALPPEMIADVLLDSEPACVRVRESKSVAGLGR